MRRGIVGVGVALALSTLGCGPPAQHPVRGSVFFLKKPAVGARVVLHPVDPKITGPVTPSAVVGEDGSFVVATRAPGDGAPAGEYRIAIAWYPKNAKAEFGGEIRNRLPEVYSDPSTSGLAATVAPQANEWVPFFLGNRP